MITRFLLASVLVFATGGSLHAEDPFGDFDVHVEASESKSLKPNAREEGVRPVWVSHDQASIESIMAKLGSKLGAPLDFPEGTPLEELLDYLAASSGMAFQIDRSALDDLGLAPDEPISASLTSETTLRAALRFVLQPLEMTYVAGDGFVTITTQEAAISPPHLVLAIYPVRDLLQDGDYRSLIDNLTSVVATDSWAMNGGYEQCELRPFPQRGALVVVQSWSVQEQVVGLLEGLRTMAVDPNAKPYESAAGSVQVQVMGGGGGFGGGGGMGGGGGAFTIPRKASYPRPSKD